VERRFELHFDRINNILLFRFNEALRDPRTDRLSKERYESAARWLLSSADLRAAIIDFSFATEFPTFSNIVGEEKSFASILCILVAPNTIRVGLESWLLDRRWRETPLLRVVRTLDEALASLDVQSTHFKQLVSSFEAPALVKKNR
jgi:hypothetical protein